MILGGLLLACLVCRFCFVLSCYFCFLKSENPLKFWFGGGREKKNEHILATCFAYAIRSKNQVFCH